MDHILKYIQQPGLKMLILKERIEIEVDFDSKKLPKQDEHTYVDTQLLANSKIK